METYKTPNYITTYYCVFTVALACFIVSCSRSRYHRAGSTVDNSSENNITIIGSPDTDSTPNENVPAKADLDDLLIPKFTRTIANQFLKRIAYVTSYNRETRNPNWVAWKLTREHTSGPFSRKGVPYYAEDGTAYGIGEVSPESIKGCYFLDKESEKPRQLLTDWNTNYNMSHGHMCPAGDNKWDKAAMNQSFLLTNMCPQDEKLNSGGWNRLEEKCRTWANLYGEIYIVTGPVFYKEPTRFLGQIAVPDAFFKVVLSNTDSPRAIGFIYENSSISQSIFSNCCTIDHVEEITGYDFFEILNDNIEDAIESQCNINDWK